MANHHTLAIQTIQVQITEEEIKYEQLVQDVTDAEKLRDYTRDSIESLERAIVVLNAHPKP
jgi:hypothetical protein